MCLVVVEHVLEAAHAMLCGLLDVEACMQQRVAIHSTSCFSILETPTPRDGEGQLSSIALCVRIGVHVNHLGRCLLHHHITIRSLAAFPPFDVPHRRVSDETCPA